MKLQLPPPDEGCWVLVCSSPAPLPTAARSLASIVAGLVALAFIRCLTAAAFVAAGQPLVALTHSLPSRCFFLLVSDDDDLGGLLVLVGLL